MKADDQNYYQRRADEEQAHAARALSDEARRAHRALAERYQALADGNAAGGGEGADGGGAVWPMPQSASPAA